MEKDHDQIIVDFIEANPDVEKRVLMANVKNTLIDLLWKKKVEKALQAMGFTNTETGKQLIINLYAAAKINHDILPQNIDGLEIEYRSMGRTSFL